MKKIEINPELLIAACENSDNMSDAARKMGLHPNTFRRKAKEVGCYAPNPTNRPAYVPHRRTKEDVVNLYLSNKKTIAPSNLRKLLIRHGFKGEFCELCGGSEWFGTAIPLELHHRDGNRYNNSLDNLLVLCPTCHSWATNGNNSITEDSTGRIVAVLETKNTTDTVGGHSHKFRKTSSTKSPAEYNHVCPTCNKPYKTARRRQIHCSRACAHKRNRRFDISATELLTMFRDEPNYTKIASHLRVSDNAIKKRCKALGITKEVQELIDTEKRTRALTNRQVTNKG